MQDQPLEHTQPASRLPYDDYLPLIPPPQPPPRSRRWKLTTLVVGVVLLLAASTSTAYLLGMQQGREEQQGGAIHTPTVSAPSPTPTAATGLASPDRFAFSRALGEALLRADTTSILPAVETTQFIISCDSPVNSTGAGCYTSWNALQGQIATGGLVIDLLTQGLDLVNGTDSLNQYCPGRVGIGGSFLLIGTFGRDQPFPNNGLAILVISNTGPGSVTTWAWSAAFFC